MFCASTQKIAGHWLRNRHHRLFVHVLPGLGSISGPAHGPFQPTTKPVSMSKVLPWQFLINGSSHVPVQEGTLHIQQHRSSLQLLRELLLVSVTLLVSTHSTFTNFPLGSFQSFSLSTYSCAHTSLKSSPKFYDNLKVLCFPSVFIVSFPLSTHPLCSSGSSGEHIPLTTSDHVQLHHLLHCLKPACPPPPPRGLLLLVCFVSLFSSVMQPPIVTSR